MALNASQKPVLVVDLDGTLIRSDMLLESFWASFAADWRTPFVALGSLSSGRAALKRRLASTCPRLEHLPYNEAVLAHARAWKAEGGRTALVTASDSTIAQTIAEHLGCFDEVHGSDGTVNLKGPHKATFLVQRFGAEGFDYIGDSAADLPVWQQARRAITVGATPGLRARVEALGKEVEHLPAVTGPVLPQVIRAMRPHQWLKNILVFFPMVAGHAFNLVAFGQSLLAFLAFGLVASSVYVLNDLLDLGPDRAHPRKRMRPFASGNLPLIHALWMVPAMLLGGLAISALLGAEFALVIVLYFFLTTNYSLWVKRRIIADICLLAGLYTLRIVAGATATGIWLSVWLLAFSMFFFFALAAVKRQAELKDAALNGLSNAKGRGYRVDDMPLVAQMATASGYVSVLVMALYLNSPDVRAQYSAPTVLWGVCLVLLYWISRVVMVAHRGKMQDDPVVFAATDRISQLSFVLIVALVTGAMVL